MRILVTGASGFAGSALVPRLLAEGHAVRAMGRDPGRVRDALTRARGGAFDHGAVDHDARGARRPEILRGDALTGEGLSRALRGVDVAYYLIHSMERARVSPLAGDRPSRRDPLSQDPAAISAFDERERIAAETFAAAAARAGVRRLVYLGGLVGEGAAATSRHLASRETVERILLDAIPNSVALRASIVIGARSRSFRFLVRLVERMPVLTLPAWRDFRTQPIDERDITAMLSASATAPVGGRSLDVGGPDVLSYGEMIARIAEVMLVHRPQLGLSFNMVPFAGRVAAAISGEDPALVLPLMEGLRGDLVAADDHAAELFGVELHSFDSAVEHALGEWESCEPLAAR